MSASPPTADRARPPNEPGMSLNWSPITAKLELASRRGITLWFAESSPSPRPLGGRELARIGVELELIDLKGSKKNRGRVPMTR